MAEPAIPTAHLVLLILALAIACGFEFINGFHDTANAVATVIYTHSLKPNVAVIWSGLCNFMGVYLGGVAVAFSIVHLLPVDLLVNVGSHRGMEMVLALLIAAIVWNFGTWYRGLPASSSHTLIGSILGVAMANALIRNQPLATSVNWSKAGEVGLSLLISPIIGFVLAAAVLLLAKRFLRDPQLYHPPEGKAPPPHWIRGLLVLTCTGVSFAHGSNDGQKGVGLMMLILIGILPARFALDRDLRAQQIERTVASVTRAESILREHAVAERAAGTQSTGSRLFVNELGQIRTLLTGKSSLNDVRPADRWQVRSDILDLDADLATLASEKRGEFEEASRYRLFSRGRSAAKLPPGLVLTAAEKKDLMDCRKRLRDLTDYAPTWVPVLIALSLGLGTMIGWKRIVVTIGEKIGKAHLTYAQGASAEIVAMVTIGMADYLGMPVSTTHVLSSGVAGTMAASKAGLQGGTVRSILLAWVLTLPAAMLLSGLLYSFFRLILP